MAVFHTDERRDMLNYIVSRAEQNEHIMALVAVGSGAFGYIDELSDLDLVVAVDTDENVGLAMDYIASQLKARTRLYYFKQMPQRRLQVFLSDQYLEIDIGYGAYAGAAAFRKDWKVLFDKTGTVDESMRRSWEKCENAPQTEATLAKAAECADVVWHNLMHTAVAIKRQRYWRAVAEMELARNQYIGLLGCRYALDTSRNRDVDRLPEAELAVLQKTLVSDLRPDALWRGLTALTDAVYTELERYDAQTREALNRRQVNEYIDFCRSL